MPHTGTSVIPFMRYRDCNAAIDWLTSVLGFEKGLVIRGENGSVEHAELTHGSGMIMLGSIREGDSISVRSPNEVGGLTAGVYIRVDDVDSLYQRAKAAGAAIPMEIVDTDYGSRDFSVTDPEGQLWSFGTYDPYAVEPVAEVAAT